MNELTEYCEAVLNNKIQSCGKLKSICEKLLYDCENPREFHFDPQIADRHIKFIEKFCRLPSGKLGAPMKLELFQKARLQAIFGFVDDNNLRQYNEVFIVEGRKNGKTSECAAIELDMLVNDREGAPQIYNLATMLDQAKLGFNAAHKMVQQSPLLNKHIKKRVADLYFPENMGFIKALASNSNSLDGLDVHCAVIDELAAIKDRDIYDLIKQAMGARRQPLLFCITTNGFIRDGIFDAQYEYASKIISGEIKNERFLPFIYELDDREEYKNPKMWVKANPGLGTIKSEKYLSECVQKAKDDITFKPTLLVKDFNLVENAEAAWLRFGEANNEATFGDLPFKYCIGGMDAADSVDLNAAKALCMLPDDNTIYVKSMYWIPETALDGKTRKNRDDAPYDIWVKRGLMRVCSGNRVDKRVFLDWFLELHEAGIYPVYIGYDPWHIDDSLLRLFASYFGEKCMIPVRQGVATLSQPMIDLKADLIAKRINYNNNPVDKMCLLNTYTTPPDKNGNIQPVKNKSNRRIDGTAALLDAYVALKKKKEEYLAMI